MSSRVLLALPVLLMTGAAIADPTVPRHATPDDMELSVADAFDRATTVIQGLADMTTAAQPYDLGQADGDSEAHRARHHRHSPAKAAAPLAVPGPVWRGRHIGPLERSTVFAVFQVTVDETSPHSFDVTVISSGFCEEVDVKDRGTQKVLATESLDDEKLFKVSVAGHALDGNVELSIGVLDPDDPDSLHFAAVPILGGTGLMLSR
ncbi:MAG TPA: hypothetical protein VK914_07895 [bacterium]|jgi:hypothetical protein|nr:hypothetical protein [bacterium]